MAKSKLDEFVQNDVKNQKGVYIPVHAGILERMFVRKAACAKLHPNAEDEFSMESVGPSYRIISEYETKFREAMRLERKVFDEPLTVEKLRPNGYLLLNGHHRWAAAMRCNIKKVPIKIINVATESDIKKILEKSQHDKRVTLDLDEVVFRPEDYKYLEKKFIFPLNLRMKQRIRLGIPALFYFLAKNGYDIWVYAADYYSIDDIQKFFRAYSVHVDGIITGVAKREQNQSESVMRMEKLIANKYAKTLHIDNDLILVTRGKTGEFEEYEINSSEEEWARKAITVIEEMEKNERKK
ncbi:ParB N-terminal domain-containing protein [Butyrivibrio sp. AE2032]|uniref:ParB N-terminal domain-containing protein n=1 Tax=Butyrivibrio sp. AE2032 TaxID=1458463 RepID=UPI0005562A5F|nr:ParB N-terminal domain-containing protein [Butyrivibrio sp. AE2032]